MKSDSAPPIRAWATPLDLEPIKARCDVATAGPWRAVLSYSGMPAAGVSDIIGLNDEHVVCFGHDYDEYGYMAVEDAEFCAHARQDIPALIAEVEALRQRLLDAEGEKEPK